MTIPNQRSGLGRRHFLGLAGAGAGLVAVGAPALIASAQQLPDQLFTLGVASGDPLPDGVVLWTRLAPEPTAADGHGGMPQRKVPVQWQVSENESFTRVVRSGAEVTTPEWGHSVHAEVHGLQPDREYWYRFRAGRELSPVGRTRTAPARATDLSEMAFGFASCSNFPNGYFTAYRHMAADELDLIVHLGDYIYEGAGASTIENRSHLPAAEIFSLADYRVRYSQYHTDVDLQAAHASAPWVVVPDDHEVENNYADDISQIDDEPDQDREVFRQRRAAAYQAYWENLPLRRSSMPKGPDMQLYRRFDFGQLLGLHMIDTRQYRSDQLEQCVQDCDGRWDPTRSMLGAAQEKWLYDGLTTSTTRWNVLGNQLITFGLDNEDGPGVSYPMDNWNGYAGARQSLYTTVDQGGVENFVVITGDAHRNTAAELKLDFKDPESTTIGAEFLGTSVSSGRDGNPRAVFDEDPDNLHIKFVNRSRGYQRVRVSKDQLQVDFRTMPYVTRPDAPIATLATATVESGRPGIADIG
ncbi:alkaline phosphatase D family protein [Microlunatus sp. Y2014]|uniref:alkaline phosphatase D family protein n=1 Tax=Microlunatus sp. Y2014 TaxID=3418488 RepID=UPI003DA6DFA2